MYYIFIPKFNSETFHQYSKSAENFWFGGKTKMVSKTKFTSICHCGVLFIKKIDEKKYF